MERVCICNQAKGLFKRAVVVVPFKPSWHGASLRELVPGGGKHVDKEME